MAFASPVFIVVNIVLALVAPNHAFRRLPGLNGEAHDPKILLDVEDVFILSPTFKREGFRRFGLCCCDKARSDDIDFPFMMENTKRSGRCRLFPEVTKCLNIPIAVWGEAWASSRLQEYTSTDDRTCDIEDGELDPLRKHLHEQDDMILYNLHFEMKDSKLFSTQGFDKLGRCCCDSKKGSWFESGKKRSNRCGIFEGTTKCGSASAPWKTPGVNLHVYTDVIKGNCMLSLTDIAPLLWYFYQEPDEYCQEVSRGTMSVRSARYGDEAAVQCGVSEKAVDELVTCAFGRKFFPEPQCVLKSFGRKFSLTRSSGQRLFGVGEASDKRNEAGDDKDEDGGKNVTDDPALTGFETVVGEWFDGRAKILIKEDGRVFYNKNNNRALDMHVQGNGFESENGWKVDVNEVNDNTLVWKRASHKPFAWFRQMQASMFFDGMVSKRATLNKDEFKLVMAQMILHGKSDELLKRLQVNESDVWEGPSLLQAAGEPLSLQQLITEFAEDANAFESYIENEVTDPIGVIATVKIKGEASGRDAAGGGDEAAKRGTFKGFGELSDAISEKRIGSQQKEKNVINEVTSAVIAECKKHSLQFGRFDRQICCLKRCGTNMRDKGISKMSEACARGCSNAA